VASDAFLTTLKDAIADILADGYSEAAVTKWSHALGEAAEETMGSPEKRVAAVRANLNALYRRVERGGLTSEHSRRVDIVKLKPVLKALRDEAVGEAAARVIEHREDVIQRTIAKFVDWAESVPVGGGRHSRKVAYRNIREPMVRLSTSERAVVVDTERDLRSQLSDAIADGSGAIAAIWHSRWRVPGYNYRKEHKARDENFYAIRGSWAMQDRLIRQGAGFTDGFERPGEWRHCRCHYEYVYDLGDLPDTMLTARGRARLRRNVQ
jgi:hypothetical protein